MAGKYIAIAENWNELGTAVPSLEAPESINEALKRISETKREERESEREEQPEIELPEGTRVISDSSGFGGCVGPAEKDTMRVLEVVQMGRCVNAKTHV